MMRWAVVAMAGGLILAACGGGTSTDVTKVRDPASVAAGEDLYEANCAACHGSDLDGGRVPDGPQAPSLSSKTGPDDAVLIEIVKRGRGVYMPTFGTQLNETEIASIIDYVRSVQAARLDG
jgi:mono/diheme cytochrome c family protein